MVSKTQFFNGNNSLSLFIYSSKHLDLIMYTFTTRELSNPSSTLDAQTTHHVGQYTWPSALHVLFANE